MRRRTRPPKPTSPLTNRVMLPGSGTAVGGPFDANPVSGPQLVPEAVQKWIATPVNWLADKPGAVRTNVNESALTRGSL